MEGNASMWLAEATEQEEASEAGKMPSALQRAVWGHTARGPLSGARAYGWGAGEGTRCG